MANENPAEGDSKQQTELTPGPAEKGSLVGPASDTPDPQDGGRRVVEAVVKAGITLLIVRPAEKVGKEVGKLIGGLFERREPAAGAVADVDTELAAAIAEVQRARELRDGHWLRCCEEEVESLERNRASSPET